MKKLISILLTSCIGSYACADVADVVITSHTFFSARPHFQSASPEREMFFRSDRLTALEDGYGTAIQVVGFGGKSTESCELAKFFMPFGKSELIVAEAKEADTVSLQGDLDHTKDIEARHFNIETASDAPGTGFRSKIRFAPQQTFTGIGFDIRQILLRCDDNNPRAWLEVAFPVEHIKNKMHLSETIDPEFAALHIPPSSGIGLDNSHRAADMIAAFKQSNWNYGKIDNNWYRCHGKWGVADVEAKLNWSNYHSNYCRLESYIGFVAPTGTKINKQHAAYVFTPVIGNNHHWGVLFGGHINFDLVNHDEHHLAVAYDLDARYLCENYQVRSFDLKDKQWSRYMEVYTSASQATDATEDSGTSGINVFTKCVKVKPYYSTTCNTALTYSYCNIIAELGYNFYARHQEKVFLRHGAWKENVALKSLNGNGQTSLARSIQKNFTNSDLARNPDEPGVNFDVTAIKYGDLNLNSAAHPAVFSNIIFGGLGYEWHICDIPLFAGIGGSYEFSSINTAINHWMVWGKVGISL